MNSELLFLKPFNFKYHQFISPSNFVEDYFSYQCNEDEEEENVPDDVIVIRKHEKES